MAKQWRRCALGDLGPGGHTTILARGHTSHFPWGSRSTNQPFGAVRDSCGPATSFIIYVYIYTYMYVYIYVHIYICTCVYTYRFVNDCLCACEKGQINTYMYIYVHTYMHTYIHTYKHTLHYITLHYTTLHYITLHYITYIHMSILLDMLIIVYVHVKKGESIPILSKFPCQYHDYMILRSETTTGWCPVTKLLTITR